MRARHLVLASSLLLWASTSGCGEDEVTPPVNVDPPEGYASSPDEAPRFLRNAYLYLEVGRMEKLLDANFTFEVSPEDADTLGLASTWDRATHLRWNENFFTGKPGIRADGTVQAPVSILEVTWTPETNGEWAEVTEGPYAGTLQRRYDGIATVQYEGGDVDFIQGWQTFNVLESDLTVGDDIVRVYRIVRWASAVPGAANKHGIISWGRLIAKFRFERILDPPPGYASSAIDLVQKLAGAYRQLDLAALDRLLHEDFVFELDPVDAETLAMSPTWNEASHLAWTDNFFSGQAGTRADGQPQAPLDLQQKPSGTWDPEGGTPSWRLVSQGPFINTLQQSFVGDWQVPFQDGDADQITGAQTFNVVERVLDVGGEWARVHQLVRWASAAPGAEPLPARKGETISWGRLIAKFRPVSSFR